jgi:DNA topoisomerase VI subunit A
MKRLLDHLRNVKKVYEKDGYIIKDHDGKPFFGEIKISFNDGKIIHAKNKSEGEFNVETTTKF